MALSINDPLFLPAKTPKTKPNIPLITQDKNISTNDAVNFSKITSLTGFLKINEFPRLP